MALLGLTTLPLTLVHYSKPATNSSIMGTVELEQDVEPQQLELEAIRSRLHKAASKEGLIHKESALLPHNFLHLHHMKTGGTSMDRLLNCARKRLETSWSNSSKTAKTTIPYYNLHECSAKGRACLSNPKDNCRAPVNRSSVLSYCAPLLHLPKLGWDMESVSSLTVLRHPVDRVWSMYRFKTKNCYRCQNLTAIYEQIDANNTKGLDPLCVSELGNHQTTNLLTSAELYEHHDSATNSGERLQQAIANLKTRFTVVGLTEDMDRTHRLVGRVFPWLAEDYRGSRCPMVHANASPKNNRCAPGQKHRDLPAHPDEATRSAIEAHNQLDLRLYEAAVQHFGLQARAMGL